MSRSCIACQQPQGDDQPYYCLNCFIPIPQYHDGIYQGIIDIVCSSCGEDIKQREKTCGNCTAVIDITNPPQEKESQSDLIERGDRRQKLAKQLLSGSDEARSMIETLGISHLSPAEQGTALAAISNEKMNFYSGDYNFVEAHTLADLGYGLSIEIGAQWAVNITGMRLAVSFIRLGNLYAAINILQDIYETYEQANRIQRLRRLEVFAYLTLAHRCAGNGEIADTCSNQVLLELNTEFGDMEDEIDEYLRSGEHKSEYIGMRERTTTFPRLDYIATILSILVEETLVRGNEGQAILSDLVLDRLLQLDNIVKILGEITPDDDAGFFAAHLREYIRLINGIYWYGDILLGNSDTKRRILLEQAFDRVKQWMQIIPVHFWLGLKPGRFLEVFIRAESWSDKIQSEIIVKELLSRAEKIHRPSFHYVFAEALANAGRFEQAIYHANEILDPKHEKILDSSLNSLAKNLLYSIQLESVGILTGVTKESEWLPYPVIIRLEEKREPFEPEPYLGKEFKIPVLKLSFNYNEDLLQRGIAIFGDKLDEMWDDFQPRILSVGDRLFEDMNWHSPVEANGIIVKGIRMDIVVIRTNINEQSLTLLFEGKKQHFTKQENAYIVEPSSLLLLRGIIYPLELNPITIIQFLFDLMSKGSNTEFPTEIFVLKSK
ncbi:MAG: hypothetical protein ACXAD7_09315 [Candidatus Kariarchaeaceae archaeon]|jgi:hypothetical protein